jgi:hypothetical protein
MNIQNEVSGPNGTSSAFGSDLCDDGNLCTDDVCTSASGTCAHTVDNTNQCNDGNSCTRIDACHDGACIGSDPVDCSGVCPPGSVVVNGGCAKSYGIDVTLLDNLPYQCGGDGTNRYGCAGTYGFHWTDDDRDLGPVRRVVVEFEAGINCSGEPSSVYFNGSPVVPFPPVGDCSCESPHATISLNGLDVGRYQSSGVNTISIVPSSNCEGLVANTSLGGYFARATVTYRQRGGPCVTGSCEPSTGSCLYSERPDGTACSDGDACSGGDACADGECAAGPLADCDDGNACTTDGCDPATGCVVTNNTGPCSDGNACTAGDFCGGGSCHAGEPVVCAAVDQCHVAGACNPATGACSNPVTPDGTICNDGDLCTTGETCAAGTCTPAHSGLNDPKPRSVGYYQTLCDGPHPGDQLTDADAICVASVANTFAEISTVADLCAELSRVSVDPCDKSEDDLLVLALNICRARVCTAQSIDSQCGGKHTVGQSLAESNAIFSSASRSPLTCALGSCLDQEINTGRALEMNTLTLGREGSAVRLDWNPPYLEDGSGHPNAYRVWRRAQGSRAAFEQIGATADPTFLDTGSGSGAYQYEVTAVMN